MSCDDSGTVRPKMSRVTLGLIVGVGAIWMSTGPVAATVDEWLATGAGLAGPSRRRGESCPALSSLPLGLLV
jgi:hypothetical protein